MTAPVTERRSVFQSKRTPPPLREAPDASDDDDQARIRYVLDRWTAQDGALLEADRQIEENIRMLAGRQWDAWSPQMGRFVDATRYMSESERRWRQRPVINWIEYWFILTKARLTENPPIVTFQPSTADYTDAALAEAMDTIWKTIWRESGIEEVMRRAVSWMIPAGSVYLKTVVDLTKGPFREVPPALMQAIQAAPDQAKLAELTTLAESIVAEREGQLKVEVINPMAVRGQRGDRPWHEKSWHQHRLFLTPEEVWTRYQVESDPDVGSDGVGALDRMVFSAGHFGATESRSLMGESGADEGGRDGFVTVTEQWEQPSEEYPKGRLTAVTDKHVLIDSARPWELKQTSPVHEVRYIDIPGRPRGTSGQDKLNPIQKTWNRGWAQILEHRNLMTNPIMVVDTASGLDSDDVTNEPGQVVFAETQQGGIPIQFIAPPPLSSDVWRTQELLLRTMMTISSVEGAEGRSPTPDASGELVKALRENSDRPLSDPTKHIVTAVARLAEDWRAILPTIWPQEKVLHYAGDDNIMQTVPLYPEMWEGSVNVVADAESMLPEGREARRAQAMQLYEKGLFGQPGADPKAAERFFEVARFPHMGRMAKVGGSQRATVEQAIGRIVQGAAYSDIPVYDWYALELWVGLAEEYMASPQFTKLDEPVQVNLMLFRETLRGALVAKTMKQMQMAPPPAGPPPAGPPPPQSPPPARQGPQG